MKNRQLMKSSRLQKNFSAEYQKFFTAYWLVVSVPNLFHRGNGLSKITSPISIKQKLPNKIYCGINLVPRTEANFKDFISRDFQNQTFVIKPFTETVSYHTILEDILLKYLREQGFAYGLEISILFESSLGRSFAFNSILTSVLSAALLLITSQLSIQDLEQSIEKQDFKILQPVVDLAFSWYQKLLPSYKLADGVFNKAPFFVCLKPDDLPLVYQNQEWVSKLQNINDFWKLDHPLQKLPIDYGIIRYWDFAGEEYLFGSYHSRQKDYQQTIDALQPYFFAKKSQNPSQDIFQQINEYLNFQLLQRRKSLLEHPFDEQITNIFLKAINEYGTFNAFVEKENRTLIETTLFFDQVKGLADEKIWLMPITTSKPWGYFLFVTHYQKSRDTVKKLLRHLCISGYPKVCFEYLSWEDGQEKNALRVEQFLRQKRHSPYIGNGNVMFQNVGGKIYIAEHAKILKQERQALIFDTIEKKVYIKGQNLTHKDLRSQSGTVEIMEILFSHLWTSLSNKEFPPSSYSKNKNEMVGKILVPLQALTQKYFHQKIPLKCSWSLYDFDLVLEKNDVNMGMIRKLG